MKLRKIIVLIFLIVVFINGCSKDEAQETSAEFTTNITGDLKTFSSFTVYVQDVKGEFKSYFKGSDSTDTYPYGNGTPISDDLDSLSVSGYSKAGTYSFTVVARSYGELSEKVDQKVKSIQINVVE